MRLLTRLLTLAALVATLALPVVPAQAQKPVYIGFNSNNYPGDALLQTLRKQFYFMSYWLNTPPGAERNQWLGKREILLQHDFGFMVIWNGRLYNEIVRAKKQGKPPLTLAKQDAAAAVAAAKREHFPQGTVLFLDQEQGGVLLEEQAAYLLGWTEAVGSSGYLPGVYASGQPVPNGTGPDGKAATITTIQDIRARVAAGHLHQIAFWVYQDACPPAPGCVMEPPPVEASGTPDAIAWQYAQSPRRKAITASCGKTYNRDGNCYSKAPGLEKFEIDPSSAVSPDPSHGH
jgi:hypothetical protein